MVNLTPFKFLNTASFLKALKLAGPKIDRSSGKLGKSATRTMNLIIYLRATELK